MTYTREGDMKNVAVVLAGGVGERMRLDMPKQLLKVAGKPIIEHTLFTLQESAAIDEIMVMMAAGHVEQAEEIARNYPKVSKVLEGGASRNDTSRKAIENITNEMGECNVLFHDAVRPFLTRAIIDRCIGALGVYNAVDVVIPSADTIIETDGEVVTGIPDRATLRRGQTPQAFKLSTIRRAYEIASGDPEFQATDDCGVVLKYLPEEKIGIVEGDETNIKVTHPLDATIADKLFQMKSTELERLSESERAERLREKTVVVFGGSYGIGGEIVDTARGYGANTYSFSRSETGTDVRNEDDISKALETVFAQTGQIDYIVNTAGVLTISPLTEMTTEELEESIRINYVAPAIMAKLSKPYLEKTNGQLLLFTSSSYTRGRKDYSLYSSSKAATVNLTQALAEEWYDDGIRINCINPERTATPMRTKAFGQEDPAKLLSATKVAKSSIDTLLSGLTGQVIDVRVKG